MPSAYCLAPSPPTTSYAQVIEVIIAKERPQQTNKQTNKGR